MHPMHAKIQEAKDQGKVGIIPFLPAGFPDRERFWKELEELDAAGASIIEIGIPFSDPVADGPVVEKATLQCVADGIDLQWIFDGLIQRKGQFKAALLLMGYYNPVAQYGLNAFGEACKAANVSGVIIADLPFEEAGPLKVALQPHGVALVPLVGLNTSRERMALYADTAEGFCYFVSVLGTTGQPDAIPPAVREQLALAREIFDVPIALGFDVDHPVQLTELNGLIDAAVFGSALVTHLENGKTSAAFMELWQ